MIRRRLLIRCALSAVLFGVCLPLPAQEQDDPLHRPAAGAPAAAGAAQGAEVIARGKAIFEGKGACQGCHQVSGVGARIAPDLSSIGSTLSAEAITKTLTDPSAALRPAVRSVRGVTKDGKAIVGVRLNEDMYTVQLIDEHEHLRSLRKKDLREYA